jgi:hypothetical protein
VKKLIDAQGLFGLPSREVIPTQREGFAIMKALSLKILSCLMIVILPVSLFAADQASAMVYTHGPALLNGNSIPRTSAIFSGDLVQTTKDSVANINATGSTVLILNDSLIQYEGDSVSLEHGGVTVSTSKSLSTRAGDVTVSPASSGWTEFEIRDVDGKVRIMARKGDLTISDDTGTATLAQGQETTRDEQSEKNKKKKRTAGGTAPAAGGGWLDSPVAIGIGTGVVVGIAAYALSRSDDAESDVHHQ